MRSLFHYLIGLACLLVLVALLLVGGLHLANARDEPLTEATLQALSYTPPTDAQLKGNGYLIIAGLDAATNGQSSADVVASAEQVGLQRLHKEIERKAWFDDQGTAPDHEKVPKMFEPPSPVAAKDIIPDTLQCKPETNKLRCYDWYVQHARELQPFLNSQAPTFTRMAAAVAAPQFENFAPAYIWSFSPPYQHLMRAHELQLAGASLLWSRGQYAQALYAVEQGSALTQRVATGSRELIGSMIAVNMRYRTLRWLNDVVTTSSPSRAWTPTIQARIQALAQIPLPSIRPGLEAERDYSNNTFKVVARGEAERKTFSHLPSDSQQLPAWFINWLGRISYLPGATLNQNVEWWEINLPLADVPADQLDAAVLKASAQSEALRSSRVRWMGLRNYTGQILIDIARPTYQGYMQRSHDIEGYRRMLLLQLKARQERVKPAQMPAWLAASPSALRNPYTLQPMQWDAASNSLVFEGREHQQQNPNRSKTYRLTL